MTKSVIDDRRWDEQMKPGISQCYCRLRLPEIERSIRGCAELGLTDRTRSDQRTAAEKNGSQLAQLSQSLQIKNRHESVRNPVPSAFVYKSSYTLYIPCSVLLQSHIYSICWTNKYSITQLSIVPGNWNGIWNQMQMLWGVICCVGNDWGL